MRMALAVSGGVDSMALAAVCSKVKAAAAVSSYDFTAMVVDHKARNGSTEEAERVKTRLEGMGLKAQVLPLTWPEDTIPWSLSNFEMQARRLRFQALGQACSRLKIDKLLLAHHADDLAETTLMRIANGHSGTNLQSIKSEGNIPESAGLFGVHQSGRPYVVSRATGKGDGGLSVEAGGVNVYRPLLGFRKDVLKKTCVDNGVEWEEDETNHDPTSTQRNAVRYLLGSGRLPLPLQHVSLTKCARKSRHQAHEVNAAVETWMQDCEIVTFDTRSGSLIVRFPRSFAPENGGIALDDQDRTYTVLRNRATQLLRRIFEVVSPLANVDSSRLHNAVEVFFPELFPELPYADAEKVRADQASSFVANKVHARRHEFSQTTHTPRKDLDRAYVWSFARQPYNKDYAHEPPETITEVQPSEGRQQSETSAPYGSDSPRFRLWDGRFWIRLEHTLPYPLIVRPLQRSDMPALRSALRFRPTTRAAFERRLADAAPDNVRFTLPVIVDPQGAANGDGGINSGRVIALPSIGMRLWNDGKGGGRAEPDIQTDEYTKRYGFGKVKFVARYKAVDSIRKQLQEPNESP